MLTWNAKVKLIFNTALNIQKTDAIETLKLDQSAKGYSSFFFFF